MKTFIAIALAIITSAPAFAGTTATSSAQTQAQSSAANEGVKATVNSYGSHIPSDTTVHTAPSLGSQGYYGSFSPDTCMVSAGAGVSIVGVGVQGATPVRDDQCAVLRGMVRTSQLSAAIRGVNPVLSAKLTQASVDMLCNLNSTVGAALQAQGLCTKSVKVAVSAAATHTQSTKPNDMASKCPACMR